MLDFLIIGAGITGVTTARLMQLKKQSNFLVIEAESEAGGLCRTKIIKNHVLDIGGGHFLCTKYPQVYNFIFSHISKNKFNQFSRVSKIQIDDQIIDYPIESNLWQFSLEKQADFLISVIQGGEALGKKEPRNYDEWIRWKLGNLISEKYMEPYNIKIWGVRPKEMDTDWLSKIPKINTKEIIISCLKRYSDREKMPSHSIFYYPKEGGFETIFNSIYSFVNKHVILNEPATKLVFKGSYWIVNDKYKTKQIINTAPWPKLYKSLGSPSKLKNDFKKLKYNSIVVSLWEKNYTHDSHWCYFPTMQLEYHREFYIHNFAPHSKKNGIYTETNKKRWPGKGKMWSNKKKPIYEHINEVAYPIPVLGHTEAISRILTYYKKRNLYGLGRWGQWKYFNSDVCIKEAIDFANSIF